MKNIFATLIVALTLASAQAADVTTKLTEVHICCDKCVKGIEKAVAGYANVQCTINKDAETVEITGQSKSSVQKVADALVAAGYFGKSSNAAIKITVKTGASGKTVQTLKVKGVHLCCAKCAKAADEAIKAVPGVTGDTAAKNVDSFEVTGNFNDKDVFAALQKAGMSGVVGK